MIKGPILKYSNKNSSITYLILLTWRLFAICTLISFSFYWIHIKNLQ
jgi:hypothetical protein